MSVKAVIHYSINLIRFVLIYNLTIYLIRFAVYTIKINLQIFMILILFQYGHGRVSVV